MSTDTLLFWRGTLVIVGLGLLAFGGIIFLQRVDPATYPGVAAWLVGAIVLHDGVGALGVFAATVLVRRADGIPFAVRAIAQGAATVSLVVTVLVIPEIVKQAIGTANPSVLPLDYLGNLVLFNAALAAVTVGSIVAVLVIRRRSSARTAARTR